MSDLPPSRELEAEVRRAIGAVDPDPAFVARLRGQLLAALPAGRRPARRRAYAWVLLSLAVLLLTAWLIGPGDVVAALQRLLGYIPGIGMVDEAGGLRLLAEPVSQERDGITLTVEQVVLDSQHTVVVFQADGIPHSAYPMREDAPFCANDPGLRLPDGTRLTAGEGGGGGWGSGFESRRVFPAIPNDVDQAVFVLPCLMDTAPGAAPEDWELRLRFVDAPPGTTLAPVLDLQADVASPAPAQTPEAMGMVLEQVIDLGDAYILIGSFREGAGLGFGRVMGIPGWPEVTNAAGGTWPFTIPDDLSLSSSEAGVFPWAVRVPKGFAAPLTITIPSVDVLVPADLTFGFDAGSVPQPEQSWDLNQEFEVAGYAFRLLSAVRHSEPRTNGYEFHFESDAALAFASVEDRDHPTIGGYGGGSPGEFGVGLVYDGPIPSGALTFHISGLSVQVPGPWSLTWSPPEGSPGVTPAPMPPACITDEAWQAAVEQPAAPPDGLSGRWIAYGRIVDDGRRLSPDNAGVFVFDPVSRRRQALGPGTWPALSPDGRFAAYSADGGLRLVDLASGEGRLVPGTTTTDYNPRFSPDGMRLAFRRVDDFNLYTVGLDGAGLQRVTDDPEYDLLVDWSADGSQLIYAALAAGGLSLRSIDAQAGAPVESFVINAKDISAALSPDGSRLAYMARLPDGMEYGLFLADLDGSRAHLLAHSGSQAITNPVWSPDGAWLLVNVALLEQTVPLLINPTTCQVVALPPIDGTVQDWSR